MLPPVIFKGDAMIFPESIDVHVTPGIILQPWKCVLALRLFIEEGFYHFGDHLLFSAGKLAAATGNDFIRAGVRSKGRRSQPRPHHSAINSRQEALTGDPAHRICESDPDLFLLFPFKHAHNPIDGLTGIDGMKGR